MSWTLSTSSAAIVKAGLAASGGLIAGSAATLAKWSDQSESVLCLLTRKDWVADYAAVTANYKPLLDEWVACDVAQKIASYDPDAYSSTAKYQTQLDLLENTKQRIQNVLVEKEYQEVMD